MAFDINTLLQTQAMPRPQANGRPEPDSPAPAAAVVDIRAARQSAAANNPALPSKATEEPSRAEQAREELQAVVERANEMPKITHRSLEFKLDEDYGKPIITILDLDEDKVIRQIPAEEIVEFAKHLREVVDEYREDSRGLVLRLEV